MEVTRRDWNPYLIGAMMTWGFNFVALKLLYPQISPAVVSVSRFAIMWVALLSICLFKKISLKVPPKVFAIMLFHGFLSMGVYMICFLEGMKDSTPAEGSILLGLSPIFTMILAVLVRQEKLDIRALGGVLVAFLGVGIVVFGGEAKLHGEVVANLLVLKSAAIWALCTVISKPLVGKAHPLAMLVISMPGAIPLLLWYGGADTLALDWSSLTWVSWAMLLYVAIVAGTIGFALFYEGVRQVGASGAMTYQYLVTPMAAIFGVIVLKSHIGLIQAVGMVIVLAGVALTNKVRRVTPAPVLIEAVSP